MVSSVRAIYFDLDDAQMVRGARFYSVGAYQVGFVPLVAWALLSVLAVALTRETPRAKVA